MLESVYISLHFQFSDAALHEFSDAGLHEFSDAGLHEFLDAFLHEFCTQNIHVQRKSMQNARRIKMVEYHTISLRYTGGGRKVTR